MGSTLRTCGLMPAEERDDGEREARVGPRPEGIQGAVRLTGVRLACPPRRAAAAVPALDDVSLAAGRAMLVRPN